MKTPPIRRSTLLRLRRRGAFAIEQLEIRRMLSTSTDIVGVQQAALDLPRTNAILQRSLSSSPLSGVDIFGDSTIDNVGFLDTGTSGVVLGSDNASQFGVNSESYNGTPVVATDEGVAGSDNFGVSEPLYVSLAPSETPDPEDQSVYTETFGPLRSEIGDLPLDPATLQEANLFGMETLAGKDMVLDNREINSAAASGSFETGFDFVSSYVYDPGTPYNPSQIDTNPGIPPTNLHIKLSYGSFNQFTTVTPAGAAGPDFGDNPFIGPNPVAQLQPNPPVDNTPPVTLSLGGLTSTGSFIFDTGAQESFISQAEANKLQVYYEPGTYGTNNPVLVDGNDNPVPNQFTSQVTGVGGATTVAGFYLDSLAVQTVEGVPLTFEEAPVLVGDITVKDPTTNQTLTLDGDFGMNFLTASASVDPTNESDPYTNQTASPFDFLVFDQPDGILGVDLPGFAGKPPTIVNPAAAAPQTVTGKSTALSVLGNDAADGQSVLTYTWATTGTPPAAVTFSSNTNGTNAAQNITANFGKAGAYNFQVTITDPVSHLTATSTVSVTVNQTLTQLAVTPSPATVAGGTTLQLTAAATDQFNQAMTPSGLTWNVTGDSTISSAGLLTASQTGGSYNVTVTSGSITSAADTVNVVPTTYTGENAGNVYYVKLAADGVTDQIWLNNGTGSPTYTIPLASLPLLTFNNDNGSEALTVDFTNGDPVPSGGIGFTGGGGTNSLAVIGAPAANAFALFATRMTVNGAPSITFANLATLSIFGGAGNDTLTQNSAPVGGALVTFEGGTGSDALNVLGGVYTITEDPTVQGSTSLAVTVGGGAGAASVTFSGDGANVHGTDPYHLASLSVQSKGTATLAAPASGKPTDATLLTTAAVTVATGGKLDITSNTVNIHYGSNATPFPTIATDVKSALITSSLANDGVHGVGYADGASGIVSGLASGNVVLKYAILGDANLDGTVSILDLDTLSRHFGISDGSAVWTMGDFSVDGSVSILDLDALSRNFGKTLGVNAILAKKIAAPATPKVTVKGKSVNSRKRH